MPATLEKCHALVARPRSQGARAPPRHHHPARGRGALSGRPVRGGASRQARRCSRPSARRAPIRRARAAKDDTLWLLYSNTKVLTACAVWLLVERGALAFTDKVSERLPGFEQNGKGRHHHHPAPHPPGGFPNADVPKAAWEDHDLLRKAVCGFTLEWTPGSRVFYHGRAAHWAAAAMIEALTKGDYRDFIRERDHGASRHRRRMLRGSARRRTTRARWTCTSFRRRWAPGHARRGEQRGLPPGGHPGGRRLRHGAGHGHLLPDDGPRAAPSTACVSSPPHGQLRHPQFHRRARGRLHGHAHAPRARASLARDHGDHPRPRLSRLPARLRARRRRLLLLLGRSGLRRVVLVPDQQPRARSLAQRAARPECRISSTRPFARWRRLVSSSRD